MKMKGGAMVALVCMWIGTALQAQQPPRNVPEPVTLAVEPAFPVAETLDLAKPVRLAVTVSNVSGTIVWINRQAFLSPSVRLILKPDQTDPQAAIQRPSQISMSQSSGMMSAEELMKSGKEVVKLAPNAVHRETVDLSGELRSFLSRTNSTDQTLSGQIDAGVSLDRLVLAVGTTNVNPRLFEHEFTSPRTILRQAPTPRLKGEKASSTNGAAPSQKMSP